MSAFPRFYPILDTASALARGFNVTAVASCLLDAGARILQYRHKGEFTQARFDEANAVARLCLAAGAQFVMNDRADFALLLARQDARGGAPPRAGLHLGQTDLPVTAARHVLGAGALIGYSTHNERQLRNAAQMPADYLALGPVYQTGSKENPDPVVGLENLARWRALVPQPLVAIGGITLHRAREVLAAGADALAVISGILPGEGGLEAVAGMAREWISAVEP